MVYPLLGSQYCYMWILILLLEKEIRIRSWDFVSSSVAMHGSVLKRSDLHWVCSKQLCLFVDSSFFFSFCCCLYWQRKVTEWRGVQERGQHAAKGHRSEWNLDLCIKHTSWVHATWVLSVLSLLVQPQRKTNVLRIYECAANTHNTTNKQKELQILTTQQNKSTPKAIKIAQTTINRSKSISRGCEKLMNLSVFVTFEVIEHNLSTAFCTICSYFVRLWELEDE